MANPVHHIELWTDDLSGAEAAFDWLLDVVRATCAARGWTELFAENYPHAGGPQHTALFVENAQGFEVEIVAE